MTHQSTDPETSRSLFRELRKEIVERTLKPLKHPSFVIYFLIAVLGCSALGIWLELYAYIYPNPMHWPARPTDALRTAILTFFPVVAGTAAMQLIWSESVKHYRSAALLILVLFVFVELVISPSRISNGSALFVGTLASLLSLWVWWIANANQPGLLDIVDPADAVGGDKLNDPLNGSPDDFNFKN